VTTLFDGLQQNLTQTIQETINNILNAVPIPIPVGNITTPLTTKIDNVMNDFTNNIKADLNALGGCDSTGTRRFLQESDNTSLADKIQAAIEDANNALASAGITINGSAEPYFDSKTFVAGVTTTLEVQIDLTANSILDILDDFFNEATADADKTGIGSPSDSNSVSNNFDQLLDDTIISAGFDITFGIALSLKELQVRYASFSPNPWYAIAYIISLFPLFIM